MTLSETVQSSIFTLSLNNIPGFSSEMTCIDICIKYGSYYTLLSYKKKAFFQKCRYLQKCGYCTKSARVLLLITN